MSKWKFSSLEHVIRILSFQPSKISLPTWWLFLDKTAIIQPRQATFTETTTTRIRATLSKTSHAVHLQRTSFFSTGKLYKNGLPLVFLLNGSFTLRRPSYKVGWVGHAAKHRPETIRGSGYVPRFSLRKQSDINTSGIESLSQWLPAIFEKLARAVLYGVLSIFCLSTLLEWDCSMFVRRHVFL